MRMSLSWSLLGSEGCIERSDVERELSVARTAVGRWESILEGVDDHRLTGIDAPEVGLHVILRVPVALPEVLQVTVVAIISDEIVPGLVALAALERAVDAFE